MNATSDQKIDATVFTVDHATKIVGGVDAMLADLKGVLGHGAVLNHMLQSVRDRAQHVIEFAKAAETAKGEAVEQPSVAPAVPLATERVGTEVVADGEIREATLGEPGAPKAEAAE